MIHLTKIFHFETAHAIYGYQGACKNIHGHSYELQVTIAANNNEDEFIEAPGFIIDFKEIKHIVKTNIVEQFDHKLILSEAFIKANKTIDTQQNLVVWKYEPTAENILIHIKKNLFNLLSKDLKLVHLKLYETKDSFAEWIPSNHSK
jgi:6-pyruvoyltetrahydropterin/6-carboxytetrahydropterin synthase